MGLAIISDDHKYDLWHSSCGTFNKFRSQIAFIIIKSFEIERDIQKETIDKLQECKKELEIIEKAKEKYPELCGMINKYQNTLQLEIKKYESISRKDFTHIDDTYRLQETLDKVLSEDNEWINGMLFPIDAAKSFFNHSDYDGVWSSKECENIYSLLNYLEIDIRQYITDGYILQWLPKLLEGLKYCADNNKNAIFC